MKLNPNFFSLFAICVMLLIANTDALAQKKPKLKGIAKELVGTWKFDDVAVFLTVAEDKLSEEQKQNFEMAKTMMPMYAQSIKGKLSYTFSPDGTYKKVEEGEDGEPKELKGTWKIEKNMLTTTPENTSAEIPEEKAEIEIADKKTLSMKMTQQGEVMGATLKFVK